MGGAKELKKKGIIMKSNELVGLMPFFLVSMRIEKVTKGFECFKPECV